MIRMQNGVADGTFFETGKMQLHILVEKLHRFHDGAVL